MTYRPSRRWLSDLARLHDALADLPLIQIAAAQALSEASDPKFLGQEKRTWSELVETRLAYHLIGSRKAAALREDAVELAQSMKFADLPPIVDFSLRLFGGQRAPADLLITWKHSTGRRTVIPVNVKVETGRRQASSFAVALAPLVSFITGGELEIRHGSDPDRTILELLAGTRKLAPARDYYLLRINTYNRTAPDVSLQGMLSRHSEDETSLMIGRHASRDTVLYRPGGAIIAPTFDVARAFGEAMIPRAREGRLGAALMAYCPPKDRRALAEALVTLEDEAVSQLLSQLVTQFAAAKEARS